jgi:hypothetical protein
MVTGLTSEAASFTPPLAGAASFLEHDNANSVIRQITSREAGKPGSREAGKHYSFFSPLKELYIIYYDI